MCPSPVHILNFFTQVDESGICDNKSRNIEKSKYMSFRFFGGKNYKTIQESHETEFCTMEKER